MNLQLLQRLGSLFLLFLFFSACKTNLVVYNCAAVSKAPDIDGRLEEWQLPLPQPSSQVDIRFRAAYDEQYLYIAVHAPDRYYQAALLAQGATIWIDTLGKRRSKIGIGYPLPISNAQIEQLATESQGDERLFLNKYAEALQEFDLIGFVEEPVRASNLSSKEMKVAASFDDLKNFAFELKMPLKQLFNRVPPPNSTFSMGIEINTIKQSPLEDSDDSSLFNDRSNFNNGVTQSNPLMGPNPNNRQMATSNRKPSMPQIWAKLTLEKLP